MYHCHVRFYLIGEPCPEFEVLKQMPPLEAFTHTFLESSQPEEALWQQADVVFADLRTADPCF
jgi:hypothetical protein